jgi:hypothetical protein
VGQNVKRPDGNGDEQSLDLIAGQRDQIVGSRPVGMLVGSDDGSGSRPVRRWLGRHGISS